MISPSVPEQPSQAPILKTTDRPGTLSKVAGAGVGTGWIVAAQKLGLSDAWTLALQAAAPSFAVGIGAVGPYVSAFIMNKPRLRALRAIMSDFEAQVKSAPEDSASRAVAEANMEQIRQMINENIMDTASIFHTRQKR
jgi:hypothetical protein